MTITCDICKKEFKYNYLLLRHQQRKRPCKPAEDIFHQIPPISTNFHQVPPTQNNDNILDSNNTKLEVNSKKKVCKYCGLEMNNNHIARHQRTKCEKIPNYKRKILIEKYNNHKSSKKQLVIHNNNTTNNNTNNCNNTNNSNNTTNNINNGVINKTENNITLKINPLGQEDLSFLTEKDKLEILMKQFMGVPELIKRIHDNPANNNFYLPNVNKKIMAFLNKENKLEYDHYNDICSKIIDENKDRFDDLFHEFKNKVNSRIRNKIRDVVLDHDTNMKINEKYTEDIRFNIMSSSKEIKEKIDKYIKEIKENLKLGVDDE
jgi:hypothetical protein